MVETKNRRKVALITGITGQDGSYLCELLLDKGYEVHGIIRRSSSFNTQRLDHIFDKVKLHYGDLIDSSSLNSLIHELLPDEIYNLAAQSHVKVSFEVPEYTVNCNALGTLRLLEAARSCAAIKNKVRIYQASTSEMFGRVKEVPQKETTPFYPRSPYGCSKVFGNLIVINYRESYGMFCVNGILFNHESPRRGKTFVTRKITQAVANIRAKQQTSLMLGNLDAKRDWGHAKDYVLAMWMMLQAPEADDFCIATGTQHSVRLFCEVCFAFAGFQIRWSGHGLEERGYDSETGALLVHVDERYFRPCEVETLIGDPSKAEKTLNWKPSCTFLELVYDMLSHDCKSVNVPLPDYSECLKLKPVMEVVAKLD